MPNRAAGLIDHIVDTYIPAADMVKGQGCVLKTTAVQAIEASVAASDELIGVLAHNAKAGEAARVVEDGYADVLMTDGIAVVMDDALTMDAGGRFKVVTTGKFYLRAQGTAPGTGTDELVRAKLLGRTGASF